MQKIIDRLFNEEDLKYKEFNHNLTPNLNKDYMIGVRTPILRKMADEIYKSGDYKEFIMELPHKYFEENQLHAFIIEKIRNYDECIEELNWFLPYVDNWATGDQCNPKIFVKNKDKLLEHIYVWIDSEDTYIIRYGIRMLMCHYLDEDFDNKYPKLVAKIKSDEYYVNMMIAWYFATALAKQYDAIVPYIENHILSEWVHKKTIQKACESFRISAKQKEYLKSFRKNKGNY